MKERLTAKNFVLGFQHLIAMFGATVLVPSLTGFNPAIALLAAGIGTLIFHFVTKGKVPVFLGSSFSFIAVIVTVRDMPGGSLAHAQGGLFVAGLIYVLLSFLIKKVEFETIQKILPPYVVGPMIIIIGLTLIPVAVDNAKGHMVLAGLTLVYVLGLQLFSKGILKQMSILIAVIMGYATAIVIDLVSNTTLVSLNAVSEASIIAVPEMTLPKFSLTAILTIVPVVLAVFMEHLGDITTNGAVVKKDFIKDPGLNRTLLGDGLATMFAAMIGGPANTTYGENTSVLAITKNYNPVNLRIAACFAIVLALVGKIGAVLQTIPLPVMGGISLVLFAMISWVGVKTMRDNKITYNFQSISVMSLMLIVGLGSSYLSKYADINIGIPISETVSLTGLSLAALLGVLLNLILNIIFKKEKNLKTEEKKAV